MSTLIALLWVLAGLINYYTSKDLVERCYSVFFMFAVPIGILLTGGFS